MSFDQVVDLLPNRKEVGLDHAVLDVLEQLLHLGRELGRYSVIPAVEGGEPHPIVAEITLEGPCRPGAVGLLRDRLGHQVQDVLLHGGQPEIGVLGVHGEERIGRPRQ